MAKAKEPKPIIWHTIIGDVNYPNKRWEFYFIAKDAVEVQSKAFALIKADAEEDGRKYAPCVSTIERIGELAG